MLFLSAENLNLLACRCENQFNRFLLRFSILFFVCEYSNVFLKGWMPPTGRQLSKVFNGYVILVDYGAISTCGFFKTAREIIPSVARYTASVIKDFNFEPRKIELIGHSLGAHLAGYIGASLNGAVNRITGI